METAIRIQSQDTACVISKADSQEFGPGATFGYLANIKRFNFSVEKLSLRFLQHTKGIFDLEVHKLATLNVNDNLAGV